MNKQDILERLDFYRDAPPELQSTILAATRYARLSPGDFLFREGDASTEFAAVGAGSIRVFRIGSTGREITLYHVRSQESSLVSMLAVLLGRPVIATGQAEVATEAVVLPASALRELVVASDSMRRYIFETVTRGLVEVTTLLEDVAFRTMDSRLGHEDIASELGTAREVVSRLLENYERRGAIHLSRGRVEMRDEAALRQLL
jgi:CRP/FNR family transcriptional regulator, anaerobic regulatory protein